ncbi:hypothetical protein [Blastococcus brunescens]|uniref:Uncharacterized protein n=1 Tax=Blastococcus brunescens TaxID=1564165 RepID=A0ABZ1AWN6_9ACTN|nr:hypothetical protein [Blastococcus sp. BMG 8361]WRL61921.1 hypothetical protein U6N30_17650 [Blastococcus sp. BMG 8361]
MPKAGSTEAAHATRPSTWSRKVDGSRSRTWVAQPCVAQLCSRARRASRSGRGRVGRTFTTVPSTDWRRADDVDRVFGWFSANPSSATISAASRSNRPRSIPGFPLKVRSST